MPENCTLSFDQGTLLLDGITPELLRETLGAENWIFDHRVGKYRTDAMRYAETRDILGRHHSAGLLDQVPAWYPIERLSSLHRNADSPRVVLRADQRQAVDAWMETGRGCIVMPTGTGKTEVALEIMRAIASSTLIVAPVRDLMYQWHRRILQRTGIDAGILGDGVHRVSPLTVTTYDSAFLHMSRIGNRFSLIIFDECHHLPGVSRQDAARMSAAPFRLGLTATHYRADGRHTLLDGLIGPVRYRQKLEEARGDTLADFDIYRIPVYLSDSERARYDALSTSIREYMVERRKQDETFTWQKLCKETGREPASRRALRAFYAKAAIEDRAEEKLRVLEDLFRLHAGEPALIFTGTNAMARDISRRFLIPCLLSHCGKKERLEVLSGLEEGRYPALVANRVLDEGVDLPDVKVAIVIGGSASPRQATQRLGRILRRSRYGRGVLYEVVTRQTRDMIRSRMRRADVNQ
jgi:superfamily II DNA or RNA helicase